MFSSGGGSFGALPIFPGMIAKSVLAIRREEGEEFASHRRSETGAHADVLKNVCMVVEAEEERADFLVGRIFVPPESCNDAIAVTLVFDLEHHALVRLVG